MACGENEGGCRDERIGMTRSPRRHFVQSAAISLARRASGSRFVDVANGLKFVRNWAWQSTLDGNHVAVRADISGHGAVAAERYLDDVA